MLNELPNYTYLDEGYAIVTWEGERVFDLMRGKIQWVVTCGGVENEFDTYSDAERFATRAVGHVVDLTLSYRAPWYVINDSAFRRYECEDRAKNFIENVLRVRGIVRRHIYTSSPL